MLRHCIIFLGLLALANSAEWPDLKTTFGLNPFAGAFHSQPRTASDAESEGWVLMASCDGTFLGHRYARVSDESLVLIYDDAGYIAGVQSVMLESWTDPSTPPIHEAYTKTEWMGQAAWMTTAYFVDPAIICNGGRSNADYIAQGTGDRLLVQLGATDNLVSIPMFQTEADITPGWFDHLCFPGMGDHYLQFDYTPDQDCNSVMPFQILYDGGVLVGFVWQHFANLPGDMWEHPNALAVLGIIDR